ncbi:MAG: RNA degradosome polyphosphate kinase, partial [Actinomyces graevenitzii]|nr:RNA degradosome polyphosphate kinase [Actinomyces graevenitzii]
MQDHAAQDVDVEEAKRTDAAIAAVIETADPRDFEDDAGPAYADEDFEEEASSDADASGVEAAIEVLEAGETGGEKAGETGALNAAPAKNAASKGSKRATAGKASSGAKTADGPGSAKAGNASAAGGAGGKADGAGAAGSAKAGSAGGKADGAGAKVDAAAGASATGTKGATGAKGAKVDSVKASGKTAANDAKADATKRAGEAKDAKPGAVVAATKTAGGTQLDGVKPAEAAEVVDPSSKKYWADIDRLQEKLPALDKFPERFVDRELTWIDFNKRVLEQAQDRSLPVLTRAWFLSIFSSNLDEFYMVRVAGLKRRIAAGITPVRASGLDAKQVLELITSRAKKLTAAQAELFQNDVRPAMAQAGIEITDW